MPEGIAVPDVKTLMRNRTTKKRINVDAGKTYGRPRVIRFLNADVPGSVIREAIGEYLSPPAPGAPLSGCRGAGTRVNRTMFMPVYYAVSAVSAVYAISSLDTDSSLRHRTQNTQLRL